MAWSGCQHEELKTPEGEGSARPTVSRPAPPTKHNGQHLQNSAADAAAAAAIQSDG
ncbi:voltage-gated chloride channel [Aspergillus luchuensis]|uniref:Voltage-gated chloride channel n=1 Tax=Aspergillus kawachii TaxID=1069201 RepID=A0A146FFJ9_ASPKA|nr:voltage-gated chloride channel [Aspergillus luchuensis]